MTAFYTTREADYLKDRQAGVEIDLYPCSDGVMRTAYERTKFEESIEWTAIGFRVRRDDPK